MELMKRAISAVSVLVDDYDEALAYYTGVMGFSVVENSDLGNGKRWVTVAPSKSPGVSLLLAKAAGPDQESRIGNQTGGRVFLFLQTDDFMRDYNWMSSKGVKFREAPRKEAYGTVAVFEDLYGNKWDLIEPRR